MSIFQITEKAFGLDISDKSIRLIQLSKNRKKIEVQLFNEVRLPDNCVVGGEVKQPKIFVDSLKKLIKTRYGKGQLSNEVIGVLPESKTYLKTIELAKTSKEDTEKEVLKLIPQHFPVDIENSRIDWQMIKSNEETQTIIIGLCPKNIVDSYVNLLSEANLIPSVMEIEATAIARTLLTPIKQIKKEKNSRKKKEDKTPKSDHAKSGPKIVIDIGSNHTGLFVYEKENIQFTISSSISGNKINNLITKNLNIDIKKAEEIKIACGLDRNKCGGVLLEIIASATNELEKNIINAITFYHQNFSTEKEISEIILCGGEANLINITDTIEQKLNIKTTVSNPWLKLKNPDPKYFTKNKSQSFVTAIGLAMRGLNPIDFL